jgi:hydrogenase-4 component E
MTGVATSAGALALTLSIVTLFAGRFGTALRICMLQALAVGLAAAAQGWARHSASLCLAALLVCTLNGLGLPMALRRLVAGTATPATIGWQCGFAPSASAAFVLVAAAVAGSMRLADGEQCELLALGMSIVLLGLLLLAVRSHRLLPVLGLLVSQNGMVVAASAIPGLPMSVLLLAAVPLVPSLAVASLWLHDPDRLALAPPWD